MTQPCHVVHLLYRFAAGGLENVLVQLVNRLPHGDFRHTIIALTEADSAFLARLERTDVEVISLHKPPGQPFRMYGQMYRLLRRLKPDVMHTCNIAALEFMPVAALAGVPRRIHAEHGWDVADPDGSNRQYQLLRKFYQRFVHQFVAVSNQLYDYLAKRIGIAEARLHLLENGVDTGYFFPAQPDTHLPLGFPAPWQQAWVFGTVGRLEPIKNQLLLVDAYIQLLTAHPELVVKCKLVIVGNGPLATDIASRMQHAGLRDNLWLPGARNDVAEILRALDCFVLPSLAEGTSCTLQEAMATGLPTVVTEVGGNRHLLDDGRLGHLVASNDVLAMSEAMYAAMCDGANEAGRAAREHVERHYSLQHMLTRYATLFRGE